MPSPTTQRATRPIFWIWNPSYQPTALDETECYLASLPEDVLGHELTECLIDVLDASMREEE